MPAAAPRRLDYRTLAARRRRVLAALAALAVVAPLLSDLAEVLGHAGWLGEVLAGLEADNLVETWRDIGDRRVMLSARASLGLGLRLDRSGTRWVPGDARPVPPADFRSS